MKKLVPIRIVLSSKEALDGTMPIRYPNFNQLSLEVRGNMDWCFFVDRRGYGMHYSRYTSESRQPDCCWTLVPRDFAEAAAKTFAEVTIRTEEEWEDFFDNNCKLHDPVDHLDIEVLQGIAARMQLEKMGVGPAPSKDLQERRHKCLDPDCDSPGVTHNCRKTWAQAKIRDQIEIDVRS